MIINFCTQLKTKQSGNTSSNSMITPTSHNSIVIKQCKHTYSTCKPVMRDIIFVPQHAYQTVLKNVHMKQNYYSLLNYEK